MQKASLLVGRIVSMRIKEIVVDAPTYGCNKENNESFHDIIVGNLK